jgi:predicted phosphodiesterase
MRVAALYDVHAMPWALEAVLAELQADVRPDTIVLGGDLVGGPYPRETLDLARSSGATLIRGNAERELGEREALLLSPDEVAALAVLPMTVTIDDVLYCHATPTDDMPMTTVFTPGDLVASMFEGVEGTVVIGHTHHQFDRTVGSVRVVNAGSVGMPYEGEVAAFWLLVEDGVPSFRRTPIDVDRAAAAILASDWPGRDEFVAENLQVAVSRDEAARYFESLR